MCVVDLVPDNLKDVQDLVWDARTKWSNLGLELGIKIADLEVIGKNNRSDVDTCFKKMLLMWLRMVDPFPSWEGLVLALGKSSVGRKDIAEKICDSIETISPADRVCDPVGQFIPPTLTTFTHTGRSLNYGIRSVHAVGTSAGMKRG